jgi:hypothetical protein
MIWKVPGKHKCSCNSEISSKIYPIPTIESLEYFELPKMDGTCLNKCKLFFTFLHYSKYPEGLNPIGNNN